MHRSFSLLAAVLFFIAVVNAAWIGTCLSLPPVPLASFFLEASMNLLRPQNLTRVADTVYTGTLSTTQVIPYSDAAPGFGGTFVCTLNRNVDVCFLSPTADSRCQRKQNTDTIFL